MNTRDAATLLPVINNHVAPGTIIHSDEWAAYNCVGRLSNVSSRNSHTARRIVLESLQNRVETDERLYRAPNTKLPQ